LYLFAAFVTLEHEESKEKEGCKGVYIYLLFVDNLCIIVQRSLRMYIFELFPFFSFVMRAMPVSE